MKYSVLILSIIIFLISSCDKNEKNETSYNVVERFNSKLTNEKLNFNKDNSSKTIVVSNSENPYDNVGFQHNFYLELAVSNIDIEAENSFDLLTQYYLSSFNQVLAIDKNTLVLEVQNLAENVFDENYNYKNDFINSILDISSDEKGIINSYFSQIDSISDLNEKVELSKIMENYLLEEENISDESKSRILRTFAIYRYSTYFWTNYYIGQKRPFKELIYDIVDAYAEYWATHEYDGPDGVFEDGSDVHMYSSFMSAICVAILGSF